MRHSHNIRIAALLLLIGLTACASEKPKLPQDEVVETLYNRAQTSMDKRDYKEAARQFQEVERQHPYSVWATRAQLMTGYALYQEMDYDSAKLAIDQFIRLHPGNEDIAYAHYLRALCDYERIADVRRDQGYTQNAQNALEIIIRRFPETTYAKDAVLKLSLISDHLAGSEMEIGRNYLRQKLYNAAIGRFRTVVEKYQTTSHVAEALHRLIECYIALGIKDEAKATGAVLGHNFPGSQWYQDSYKLLVTHDLVPESDRKSWIGQIWNDLF